MACSAGTHLRHLSRKVVCPKGVAHRNNTRNWALRPEQPFRSVIEEVGARPGFIPRCHVDAFSGGTEALRSGMGAAARDARTDKTLKVAPYGTWESPLTAAMVTNSGMRFGGMVVGPDDRLLWLEGRPSEGGRSVLVTEAAGSRESSAAAPAGEDVTPEGMSVRSKVHEYGGGAFRALNDTLLFCNQADQRVYCQRLSGLGYANGVVPVSPEYPPSAGSVRYADFAIDERRSLAFCVREDHRPRNDSAAAAGAAKAAAAAARSDDSTACGAEQPKEPINEIVALDLSAVKASSGGSGSDISEPRVVVQGADFYACPRLSPDGRHLAWVQWSHPNMPWDRTSVWLGELSDAGEVIRAFCVAGGDEAVVEAPGRPVWSPDGQLYFVSDRGTGFWNIHRAKALPTADEPAVEVECVCKMEAEFSVPFWVFGHEYFVFCPGSSRHIICSYRQGGMCRLGLLDVESKELQVLTSELSSGSILAAGERRVFVAGGTPQSALTIYEIHLSGEKASCTLSPLWRSSSLPDPALSSFVSVPSWVEFPAPLFPGEVSFAAFYTPHNPHYTAPEGHLPPLLVRSHGGPTGSLDTTLNLGTQFWTSRGWAVADVNYSGSTGYGRAYRERLYGRWGVADVADIRACAEFLVEQGLVDGRRIVTDGSSAGGFTCLAALTFTDTFKAGCSKYGIGDLAALDATTHKFEAHYNSHLLGPPAVIGQLYLERSPIHHVGRLNCPLILFQGLEDKVVLPEQARVMYEAVRVKGMPVALVEYPGEDHGFRKADNIQRTMELEILFFSRTLLGVWELPGICADLAIENLPLPVGAS